MAERLSYHSWRATEFVDDLKAYRDGKYVIDRSPCPITASKVTENIMSLALFSSKNWRQYARKYLVAQHAVVDKTRDILNSIDEGRSPVAVLSELELIASAAKDLAYHRHLHEKSVKRTTGLISYRGKKVTLLQKHLPESLKVIDETLEYLDEEDGNIYYAVEGLFKHCLPDLGKRFSKTRPDRKDPWRPVWDLVWPYQK